MAKMVKKTTKDLDKIENKNRVLEWIILIGIVGIHLALVVTVNGWFLITLFIVWLAYELWYFGSEEFNAIKKSITANTEDCNRLNSHIEGLKKTSWQSENGDYGFGQGEFQDYSGYNYQRSALSKATEARDNCYVYNCSLLVMRNAQNRPFKYICKYFGIKEDEDTLTNFEEMLNAFAAVEQGKTLLQKERKEIMDSIIPKIPLFFVNFRRETLEKKLGFQKINFSMVYCPEYIFQYISPGANKREAYCIKLDAETLDQFVTYLSKIVKFRKSVAGQRALMTLELRTKIKKRDHYTCQKCGASTKKEPNLLLEIDHVKPLSRGGLTAEENLRTLCWRCNRKKGAKIDDV